MKKLKATNLQELADELNAIDRKYEDNYYTPEYDPQAVYDSSELLFYLSSLSPQLSSKIV